MWNRPRFDLKVRLTLLVAGISAVCFAAISAYFLVSADRAAHARIDGIAAIVAKSLELQQGKVQWVANPRSDFPNLDPVSAYVMTPGLCLAFRGASGEMLQRFCSGAPAPESPPPTPVSLDEAPPVEIYAPAGEGAAIAWLYRHGRVLDREIEDDGGTRLVVRLSDQALGQFEQLFPHAELTHH